MLSLFSNILTAGGHMSQKNTKNTHASVAADLDLKQNSWYECEIMYAGLINPGVDSMGIVNACKNLRSPCIFHESSTAFKLQGLLYEVPDTYQVFFCGVITENNTNEVAKQLLARVAADACHDQQQTCDIKKLRVFNVAIGNALGSSLNTGVTYSLAFGTAKNYITGTLTQIPDPTDESATQSIHDGGAENTLRHEHILNIMKCSSDLPQQMFTDFDFPDYTKDPIPLPKTYDFKTPILILTWELDRLSFQFAKTPEPKPRELETSIKERLENLMWLQNNTTEPKIQQIDAKIKLYQLRLGNRVTLNIIKSDEEIKTMLIDISNRRLASFIKSERSQAGGGHKTFLLGRYRVVRIIKDRQVVRYRGKFITWARAIAIERRERVLKAETDAKAARAKAKAQAVAAKKKCALKAAEAKAKLKTKATAKPKAQAKPKAK